MTNTLRHNHSEDHSELLSSYLDNAVSLVERRKAEALLKSCEACAAELADLRSLQAALRALPAPMPRRSFTIDPYTVRPRRLLFPIFRTASFATALLLFILVGVDIFRSPQAASTSGGGEAGAAQYSARAQDGAGTAMESGATIPALAAEAPNPNGPQSNVSPGLAPTTMAAAGGAAGAAAAATEAPATEAAPAPAEAAAAALQAATPASEAAMPEAADAATKATTAAGVATANDENPVAGAARESMPVPAPPPGGAGGDAVGLAYPAGNAGGGAAGGDMPIEQAPQPETGAADTRMLQVPEQPDAPRASLGPLRIAQYLLALVLLGLALATWWTARRRI